MTTDQQTIEATRAAFEDIIDEAPLPPEWSTVTGSVQRLHLREDRPRWLVGVGAALGAAAVVIVAIGAVVVFSDGSNDAQGTPATTEVPPTTAAPELTSTTAVPKGASAPIDITDGITVVASSELPGFEAIHLVDGDLDRAWNDAGLRGLDAEITITFSHPVGVGYLVVHPLRDEERFLRNYRVQGYEITTDDLAEPISGRLTDTLDPQQIDVASTATTVLTLKVTTRYPSQPFDGGPPFDELAIAEIRVFGDPLLDEPSATNPIDTTTTIAPPVIVESTTSRFTSPDLDVPEDPFLWDHYVANAKSGDVPVELRGQLFKVNYEVMKPMGALPLEYYSDVYEVGVHESATFLLDPDSNILVSIGWQEWDAADAPDANPLGFPDDAVSEQWGPDRVLINIDADRGEFGLVNESIMKVVRFATLNTAQGSSPLTISEAEMRRIAADVFAVIES